MTEEDVECENIFKQYNMCLKNRDECKTEYKKYGTIHDCYDKKMKYCNKYLTKYITKSLQLPDK